MWSRNTPHHRQHSVPDSLDEDEAFQVVYGDATQESDQEAAQEEPAGRARYVLLHASSTVKQAAPGSASGAAARSMGAVGMLAAPPPLQQVRLSASPTVSGRQATSPSSTAETAAVGQQPLTLAQELQNMLSGLTQHSEQPAEQLPPQEQQPHQEQQERQQEQENEEEEEEEKPGATRRQRSGLHHIKDTNVAVLPASLLPPQLGGVREGRHASGRRWRPPEPNAPGAMMAHCRSPAVYLVGAGAAANGGTGGGGGTGAFFDIDADLLQAHTQRQALQAGQGHARQEQQQRRRRPQQQRIVQWHSPQAASQAGQQQLQAQPDAEHTPQTSQRPNPLAVLLGSSGGSITDDSRHRPVATGSRLTGRHPIYGTAAPAGPGAAASSNDSASRLSLSEAPLTSPRQLVGQRQQPQQHQHQHSRFAIREPAGDTSADMASSQQPVAAPVGSAAVPSTAAAAPGGGAAAVCTLRLPTGSEPASALRRHHFHPRPQRPPSPEEAIEEEEWEQEQAGPPAPQPWQQQEQAGAWGQSGEAEGPGVDAFSTPGQPLHRSRQAQELEEQQEEVGGGHTCEIGAGDAAAAAAAAGVAAPETATSSGSTGGKALALQRQFIAQLQPVSRPAAAATMQQQRQRLAGAAGLHARMQAILAAERAGLAVVQSPLGDAAAGPRLTVVDKALEASVTKCHCRCNQAAAAALGAWEVLALLQNRAAREVDTTPSSVILLREPWHVIQVAGSPWPVVLCFAVAMG